MPFAVRLPCPMKAHDKRLALRYTGEEPTPHTGERMSATATDRQATRAHGHGPQHQGRPGVLFLVYLAFISAFAPLSTDLYLPALPAMSAHFGVSNEVTSYTLSGFIFFFATSMLLWGPLSDKYGRRPILLLGGCIYVLASLICLWSEHIATLIAGRCLQAIGSGALSALSTAMVKDRFSGLLMERVLAIVQTLTVLAPMLAPLVGGALLMVTTWRGIFVCLVGCGALAAVGALLLPESLHERQQGSLGHSLGRLAVVMRVDAFRQLLWIFSANTLPFMAYLAVSAHVFQGIFGISPQGYSLFFAMNAACSLFGPLLYVRFLRHVPRRRLVAGCFALVGVMGVMTLCCGQSSPWVFAALVAPVTFAMSALRPLATVLMLKQYEGDTGSLSALMGCGALMCGTASMFAASLPVWPSPIVAVGVLSVVMSAYCLWAWRRALRAGVRIEDENVE